MDPENHWLVVKNNLPGAYFAPCCSMLVPCRAAKSRAHEAESEPKEEEEFFGRKAYLTAPWRMAFPTLCPCSELTSRDVG